MAATAGAELGAVPAPPGEPALPGDDSAGLVKPGVLAALLALVAMAVASGLVRRAGREEVVAGGGAADLAYGPDGPLLPPGVAAPGTERIDVDELAEHATTEFAPPPDLTPPEGGILLTEQVRDDHKVAWLIDQASHGAIDLETAGKKTTLRWRGEYGATANPVLLRMFHGRRQIELGHYDSDFGKGWKMLGSQLDSWRRSSPLWSAAAEHRRVLVLAAGLGLAVLGLAGVFLAAMFTGLAGRWVLPLVGVASLVAGAGTSMAVRSWELRVRTGGGSALWLRTDRFGGSSPPPRPATPTGRPSTASAEYTAWAVALGEIDHWSKAVDASALARRTDPTGVYLAALAPGLGHATSSAATAPSSSGGGGGGVGGGAGGGAAAPGSDEPADRPDASLGAGPVGGTVAP